MKSDRMDVNREGVTGGDDANPGHPNRNTIPADYLFYQLDRFVKTLHLILLNILFPQ